MRDPLSRFSSSSMSRQDSWLGRVRDNFQQLLLPVKNFPSSANGAPIHLLKLDPSARPERAQSLSLLTHAIVITAVALLAARPPGLKPDPSSLRPPLIRSIAGVPSDIMNILRGPNPSRGRGAGGDQNPIPATRGNLVPISSIQLVRPSLPPKREAELPVPPTILDLNAPPILKQTEHIGLPWMKDYTDSPGPGKGGIGSSVGTTMGDSGKDGPGGDGESASPYQPGMTQASCAYCPDPQYTDEAREAKLQGSVTLHVLVGADGRASQIRLIHGIGLGLDDRAVQSVRGWKFIPARDAAHRAIPQWVTIEAIFRLF